MKTVDSEWRSYSREALPKEASTVHRIDQRRAFYAGAAAMLALTHETALLPTADALARMQAFERELNTFCARVVGREA